MKSIILSSVVTALLVFSGCSDKKPVVDETTNVVNEVESVNTEKVSSEQGMINSSGANSIADIEGKLGSIYFGFDEFTISDSTQDKVSMNA